LGDAFKVQDPFCCLAQAMFIVNAQGEERPAVQRKNTWAGNRPGMARWLDVVGAPVDRPEISALGCFPAVDTVDVSLHINCHVYDHIASLPQGPSADAGEHVPVAIRHSRWLVRVLRLDDLVDGLMRRKAG